MFHRYGKSTARLHATLGDVDFIFKSAGSVANGVSPFTCALSCDSQCIDRYFPLKVRGLNKVLKKGPKHLPLPLSVLDTDRLKRPPDKRDLADYKQADETHQR